MVDSDKILSYAIPVILLILLMGLGAWLVSTVGLPFLDQPDTFEVRDVTSFDETDSEVIINLESPSRSNELKVLVDGVERTWNNNTIRVNKSGQPVIAIEAYPGNRGLYDRIEYPLGDVQNSISAPDTILTGQMNTYSIQSSLSNSDIQNIRWYIDDSPVGSSSLGIDYEFNQSGTYNMTAQFSSGGVDYTTEKQIQVFDPDEIVFDVNATNTSLVTFQSFDLRVEELTNQSVQEVDIDWGNGENRTVSINESTRYWYREPGQYEITIFGESPVVDAQATTTLNVTVTQREDPEEISRINVNVFDSDGFPLSNSTVSIGSVTKLTDKSGFARFRVQPDQYELEIKKGGYVSKTKTVLVVEDVVTDVSLVRVTDNTPVPADDDADLNFTDTELGYDEPNNTNQTEIPINNNFDSLTLNTFENLNGTGTEENPYQITNYLDLQSIRVQPSANYELVDDIDASISSQQDLIESVDGAIVGTADESSFRLPHLRSEPSNIDVRINRERVDSEAYETTVVNEMSETRQPSVYMSFVRDGNLTTPQEQIGVEPDSEVSVSYELPSPQPRGFQPIDVQSSTINIDGNGYTINNLYINRPLEDNVGLLTEIGGARIENLQMSTRIRGGDRTGAIVSSGARIRMNSVQVGGTVIGEERVGGVIGSGINTRVSQVYSSATVEGESNVGGIAGVLSDGARQSSISDSISRSGEGSYISGEVSVGGLVGELISSNIRNSYARARVVATYGGDSMNIGGIAGDVGNGSLVNSVYTVTPISVNTENTSDSIGGIVGNNDGSVDTGYWNIEADEIIDSGVGLSEQGTVENVRALSTDDMRGDVTSTMAGLDFEDTWNTEADSYPYLQSESEDFNLTVSLTDSGGEELQSPSVTIIQDGTEIDSAQLEQGVTTQRVFRLEEGQYTIQANTADFSQSTTVRLLDDRSINLSFGDTSQ